MSGNSVIVPQPASRWALAQHTNGGDIASAKHGGAPRLTPHRARVRQTDAGPTHNVLSASKAQNPMGPSRGFALGMRLPWLCVSCRRCALPQSAEKSMATRAAMLATTVMPSNGQRRTQHRGRRRLCQAKLVTEATLRSHQQAQVGKPWPHHHRSGHWMAWAIGRRKARPDNAHGERLAHS